MRIKLVVKSTGGSAVWQREVERPYVAVPRADDWVYLGESDDGHGLFATPVAVVTWENDGRVMLRFDVAGGDAQAHSWLATLGFTQEREKPG